MVGHSVPTGPERTPVSRVSAGASRRSGDPRKRAGMPASVPPGTSTTRRRLPLVLAGVAAVLVVGAAAVLALGLGSDPVDERALGHAQAACDLTAKAGEAASVDDAARLAAATLLLDRALLSSERAAQTSEGFAELDQAVQAFHAAAHTGRRDAFMASLEDALAACDAAVG